MPDISEPFKVTEYPDPTEEELKDPLFEAIWSVIKTWDLSERAPADGSRRMYTEAMGNHAVAILHAVKAALCVPITVKLPDDFKPASMPAGALVVESSYEGHEPNPEASDNAYEASKALESGQWLEDDGSPVTSSVFDTLHEGLARGEMILVAWAYPQTPAPDRKFLQCHHLISRTGSQVSFSEFCAVTAKALQAEVEPTHSKGAV